MAVPRAVQRQAEEAEALQKQAAEHREAQSSEVTRINSGQNDQGQPPVQNAPPPEGSVDWEHRFKQMKKSHDETVTGLRERETQLSSRVGELEELIRKAKPEPTAVQEVQFTAEEIEEYGEDLLSLVKRVASSMATTQSDSQVKQELKELKDQFGNLIETQVKSESERFFEELGKAVPDWEDINESQDFKDWLAELMPLTNIERQYFLMKAQENFDAKTVAGYFNSWKGEAGMQTYYPDSKTTIESEVDGNRGGRDTYVYTGAEIEKFYDDKRRGRYKGRESEARQLEQRIFQAQKENRVR